MMFMTPEIIDLFKVIRTVPSSLTIIKYKGLARIWLCPLHRPCKAYFIYIYDVWIAYHRVALPNNFHWPHEHIISSSITQMLWTFELYAHRSLEKNHKETTEIIYDVSFYNINAVTFYTFIYKRVKS